jgi:site-specific DNA-methyltransferase (adenine-specific)
VKISIAKLSLDPKNARKHSQRNLDAIAASLLKFGQRKPLVVHRGVVLAGNGTLEAARSLGWTEIEVAEVPDDWDNDTAKAYALADNRTAELAEWDESELAKQLLELQDADWDITELGFEVPALADIEPADEDEIPEPPVEPKTKLGDIYQLGRHRLMCGDSTDLASVERLMDGAKADMIFTDPPYGVDYKGIHNDSRDGLEDLLRSVFANYVAVSTNGASIYVFHSDRSADIFHKVFREFFHFSSMIIWFKNSLTLSQTDYQSQHEPCLYGWADNGTHNFYGDRKQVSVWQFEKERVEGHTTPKPVELVKNALNNSSKQNQSVIDLFGGSGSTLIAAEQTNRTCFMMEIDPKYCDVIVTRWENLTKQKAELVNSK